MVHPRTGKRLEWTRVADYYHASERIWTMADILFGKGRFFADFSGCLVSSWFRFVFGYRILWR